MGAAEGPRFRFDRPIVTTADACYVTRMAHRDREVRRAYGRDWMKRNAAKAREAMSRWRAGHREQDRANKRDYYARNPERSKAAVAAYRLANPEVVRVVRRLRRAREVAAVGAYTTANGWIWSDSTAAAVATAASRRRSNPTIAFPCHEADLTLSRTSSRAAVLATPESGPRPRMSSAPGCCVKAGSSDLESRCKNTAG